ncbi:serine/threonine-protein kinase Sgk1-like [Rhinoderma darwinii]|uniref:serine/threonine-protein kinase Sgk1-like n=1 Tax=Rhinoderma darwinii TaxID=43563 RepID=UPI003F6763CC
MGSPKKSKEDPKSNGGRKRSRDGSKSSGSKIKRPCPEEEQGDRKRSGDGSKLSGPKNKRPCPEEDHGKRKRSRKRSGDGSKSSEPKNKRPCPEEEHGDVEKSGDGPKLSGLKSKRPCPEEEHVDGKKGGDGPMSSGPKNKRPCPEEEHGEAKKSKDEPKSSGLKNKRPCPEEEHGQKLSNGDKKRKREEDGSCGSIKRLKKSISNAREEKEPMPESSNAPQSCPSNESQISIARFKFGRIIGQGAYGKVFLASDNVTKKMLAIKVVTKGLSAIAEQYLQLEKKILQLTSGSPFLVNSCMTFQTTDHWCFAMDYASGGDLRRHLKIQDHLPITSAKFYAAEIISGLQFLHTKGFIHRDIKPSNILLDGSGHLKIADFGLAVDKMDGVSGLVGTLGYIAPEITAGKTYNAAADWYSFGIVLYQLTTGAKSCNCKVSNFLEHDLDTDTENIIEELLCEDPSRRLGINGYIRQHPFFQDIDWQDLEDLKIPPPFIPGKPSEK